MISAQRIICIKRCLSTDRASWKFFIYFYLKKVGGKFLFHCNFNYTKLSIALAEFYTECIVTWALLNEDNPFSLSEIANQVIWNNRFICIESKQKPIRVETCNGPLCAGKQASQYSIC